MGDPSHTIADTGTAGDGSGGRFEQVAPARQRQALSLLLRGRISEQDPAVDQFLHFSQEQNLSLEALWMAWRGATPAGAVLIVPCAGRTAMLFVSPPASWYSRALTAELVRTACRAIDPQQVRMIQSLLDLDQTRQQEVLRRAGFEQLATLRYMRTHVNRPPAPLDLSQQGITVEHWSERNRPRFAAAILASYEQTLDCPGLLGVRDVDDIIAGHMAVGRFDPRMWHLLYHGEEPAGVMLLNEMDHADGFELVYLGLSVPFRGRGLGRALLEHAMGQAALRRRSHLLLAVDERNTPAMQLYDRMGFHMTGRKCATILKLP